MASVGFGDLCVNVADSYGMCFSYHLPQAPGPWPFHEPAGGDPTIRRFAWNVSPLASAGGGLTDGRVLCSQSPDQKRTDFGDWEKRIESLKRAGALGLGCSVVEENGIFRLCKDRKRVSVTRSFGIGVLKVGVRQAESTTRRAGPVVTCCASWQPTMIPDPLITSWLIQVRGELDRAPPVAALSS
jgi:hypothetical protein